MRYARTRVQLQIPKAPRKVALRQVPGALRRLAVVSAIAALIAAGIALAGFRAAHAAGDEAGFYERAVEVPGKVSFVSLPKWEDRVSQPAKLTVLYVFDGRDYSASGVPVAAERGEGLGLGADVTLLVDPRSPDRPREAVHALQARSVTRLAPTAVALGVLLALLLVGWELRRAVRSELQPLRHGMLVWLTCDGGLPDTRAETTFAGHYFQADVKHAVRARARPGRAPVKNGDKVLAAVVPSKPTWVRVIDEDLARTLGWL